MEYIFGTLAFLLLLMAVEVMVKWFKSVRAMRKADAISDTQKHGDLIRELKSNGFGYDSHEDILYGLRDGWLKAVGYGRGYEENMLVFYGIVDIEPVYFQYEHKNWVITLRKGQYGIHLGGEINIYKSDKSSREYQELTYTIPDDAECPLLDFTLKQGCNDIMKRQDRDWQVNGFRVGAYAEKEELTMAVQISFPNREMRNAFYEALAFLGYGPSEAAIRGNAVHFMFGKPKSEQPRNYGKWYVRSKMWRNRRDNAGYQKTVEGYEKTVDRLNYLRYRSPRLYQDIIRGGRTLRALRGQQKDII